MNFEDAIYPYFVIMLQKSVMEKRIEHTKACLHKDSFFTFTSQDGHKCLLKGSITFDEV